MNKKTTKTNQTNKRTLPLSQQHQRKNYYLYSRLEILWQEHEKLLFVYIFSREAQYVPKLIDSLTHSYSFTHIHRIEYK